MKRSIIMLLLVFILILVTVAPVGAVSYSKITWTAWGLNDRGQSFPLTDILIVWQTSYGDQGRGSTVMGYYSMFARDGYYLSYHAYAYYVPGCYPGTGESGMFLVTSPRTVNTTWWCPHWYPT